MNQNRLELSLWAYRKPLAAAVLAATIAGCGSDDNRSNSTLEPEPTFSISNPALVVDTLASSLTFNSTVLAQFGSLSVSPELLVDRIAITNAQSFVDNLGVLQDFSGNQMEVAGSPFDFSGNPIGAAGDNYFQTTFNNEFGNGENQLRFTAHYGDDQSISRTASVVKGYSWMKEAAIQYDASGNLYSLDQIDSSIIVIDPTNGAKSSIDGLMGIDNPVDFLVNGSSAYVLDQSAGIFQLDNFDQSGNAISVNISCAGDEAFKDAVAFDANFDASGNEVMFYIADRGKKEVVLVEADGDCSILSTPDVMVDDPLDDGSGQLSVPGLKLDLPMDIAYHEQSDKLFITGAWVEFDSVAEDILDASGNVTQQASTRALGTVNQLVIIDLGSGLAREPVEWVSESGIDASGNDRFFDTVFSERLLIEQDELYIFARSSSSALISADAVFVSDISTGRTKDPASDDNAYVLRPVSGDVQIFETGSTSDAIRAINGLNPDDQIPLAGGNALAKYGNTITLFSIGLGSYIDIDLSAPSDCEEFDIDSSESQDGAVLQCEFSGERLLWPGGAAIAGTDPAEVELDQDDGYEVSARAGAIEAEYSSVVGSSIGFLSFNKRVGLPALRFGAIEAFGNADNRLDQFLVADGKALAASVDLLNQTGEYFVVDTDNDRLLSFNQSTNQRSVVSESAAGAEFVDPIAAEIRGAYIDEGEDEGEFDRNFLYVLDRTQGLIKIDLSSEDRGSRELVTVAGVCDFSDAVAMDFVGLLSADKDDDGNVEGDGNERFERLATLLVASVSEAAQELLIIDLLNETCSTIAGLSLPEGVVSFDLDIASTTQTRANDDGTDIGAVESRGFTFMALGAAEQMGELATELQEISCIEDVSSALPLTCSEDRLIPLALNQPLSPAAVDVDWTRRTAQIFDNKVNSIFTVDIAPRTGEDGVPVDLDDAEAEFSGQTVITERGMPFNCDPVDDSEGCKNI